MKLSDITTFRIGGEAKYFFEIRTIDELIEVVKQAKTKKLPIFVIGEGSNLLVSDEPLDKIVIKLKNNNIIEHKRANSVVVEIGAGMNWDKFVEWSVDKNYHGVECLSYIPGLVGAAPVQNIGAYGQELSDTFVSLQAFDTKYEKLVEFKKDNIEFGYRESIFKRPENEGRYIIYTVSLTLKPDGKPTIEYKALKDFLETKGIDQPSIKQVREAVVEIRKSKLEDPKEIGNAGSFFKNPVVSVDELKYLSIKYPDIPYFEYGELFKIPAAWLVETSGWKGKKYKNVGVSSKHALVLVNYGKGSAAQIRELADLIKKDIKERFGIDLEQEVRNY